jgi:tetratricopeptide (TPR) repeat protein
MSCRALCCRELAILHRKSGCFDRAARFLQFAVKAELRAQGQPSGVSLWLAACEAREAGRDDDAKRLLDASARSVLPARVADVLAERGRLCRREGDLPNAITHLRRSARLLIREGDQFTSAVVLEELGRTCRDDQRFRTAAKMLNRAGKLHRRLGRAGDARRVLAAAREANRRHRVLQAVADRN